MPGPPTTCAATTSCTVSDARNTATDPLVIEHVRAFVQAFVEPARRDRLSLALTSPRRGGAGVARKRADERASFVCHDNGLDMRFCKTVPHRAEERLALLQARGLPAQCVVIGTQESRLASTPDVLPDVLAGSPCQFLSFVPGRLAYWIGEFWNEAYLLVRDGAR